MTDTQRKPLVRKATDQETLIILQDINIKKLEQENRMLRDMVATQRRKLFQLESGPHGALYGDHNERLRWLSVQCPTSDTTHVILHYSPGTLFINAFRGDVSVAKDVIHLEDAPEIGDVFDGSAWYLSRVKEVVDALLDNSAVIGISDGWKNETAEDEDLPPFIEENYSK